MLKTGYEMQPHAFPAAGPETNVADAGTRYVIRSESGSSLTIELQADPCDDSMSGKLFTNTVTVSLDSTFYRGCGSPVQ